LPWSNASTGPKSPSGSVRPTRPKFGAVVNEFAMISSAYLAPIPIVDVREGGPLRHAVEGRARARALREAALAWFPRGMLALTPALDRVARRWLTRSHGPYVTEI